MNEGSKYPIRRGDRTAIYCDSEWCACFGSYELYIYSDSDNSASSYCQANRDSFNLPSAKVSNEPSINGGYKNFQLKQFEVYSVSVRITINIVFRNYERSEGVRETFSSIFINTF